MKHGKHYVDAAKLVDSTKAYDVNEALELACKTASAKFDETVELHVRLGVDGRHADQQVRGAVVLPNGTGRTASGAGDHAHCRFNACCIEVGHLLLGDLANLLGRDRCDLGLVGNT